MSPAKTADAIEMLFVSRTRVGPGKHLLHILDRLEVNNVLYGITVNRISPREWIWISPLRIKLEVSHFARRFIGIQGRESQIYCRSTQVLSKSNKSLSML